MKLNHQNQCISIQNAKVLFAHAGTKSSERIKNKVFIYKMNLTAQKQEIKNHKFRIFYGEMFKTAFFKQIFVNLNKNNASKQCYSALILSFLLYFFGGFYFLKS